MASLESSDNEIYSAARKQNDQWVACITPADFLIDNEGSLTKIKDMLIQQISLQRLYRIGVHFKIAGYRNKATCCSMKKEKVENMAAMSLKKNPNKSSMHL